MKSRVVLLFVMLCLAFSAIARPQDTGSISGTVSDQSGGVIPGATVTLTEGAGHTHTLTTDEHGHYVFRGLAAGKYDLAISIAGFKTFEKKTFELAAAQNAEVNASLEPSAVVTSTSVEGTTET